LTTDEIVFFGPESAMLLLEHVQFYIRRESNIRCLALEAVKRGGEGRGTENLVPLK